MTEAPEEEAEDEEGDPAEPSLLLLEALVGELAGEEKRRMPANATSATIHRLEDFSFITRSAVRHSYGTGNAFSSRIPFR